ncbi:hypothetical protein Droror1_Dr00026942 [Drosera rotundifolia]
MASSIVKGSLGSIVSTLVCTLKVSDLISQPGVWDYGDVGEWLDLRGVIQGQIWVESGKSSSSSRERESGGGGDGEEREARRRRRWRRWRREEKEEEGEEEGEGEERRGVRKEGEGRSCAGLKMTWLNLDVPICSNPMA